MSLGLGIWDNGEYFDEQIEYSRRLRPHQLQNQMENLGNSTPNGHSPSKNAGAAEKGCAWIDAGFVAAELLALVLWMLAELFHSTNRGCYVFCLSLAAAFFLFGASHALNKPIRKPFIIYPSGFLLALVFTVLTLLSSIPKYETTPPRPGFVFAFGTNLSERLEFTNHLLAVYEGKTNGPPLGLLGVPVVSNQVSLKLHFMVQNNLPETAQDLEVTVWIAKIFECFPDPLWKLSSDENSTEMFGRWTYRVPMALVPLSGNWVGLPALDFPMFRRSPGPIVIRLMARANRSPSTIIQFSVGVVEEFNGISKPYFAVGYTNRDGSVDIPLPTK